MVHASVFILYTTVSALLIWLRSNLRSNGIVVVLLIVAAFSISLCTQTFGFDVKVYNWVFEGKRDAGLSYLGLYYVDHLRVITDYKSLFCRFVIIAASLISIYFVTKNRPLVYVFIIYANIQTLLWGGFKLQLTIPFIILYFFFLERYFIKGHFSFYILSLLMFIISVGFHPNNIVLILPILLALRLKEAVIFFVLSLSVFLTFLGSDLIVYISERYMRYIMGDDFFVNPWYHRTIEIIINIIIVIFFILNPKLFKNKYKIFIFSILIFHIVKIFLNVFEISSHLQGRALLPFYILEIFLVVRMNILNIYRIRYLFLLKSYFSIRAIVVLFGSFKYALKG